MNKKYYIAPLIALSVVAIFSCGVLLVHAQLVVNGLNINNAFGACSLYGSNIPVANDNNNDPAPIAISADGKVYAITGNYNLKIDCGDQAEQADCTNLTTAIAAMENVAQGISDFPQATQAPSASTVTFKIGHFGGAVSYAFENIYVLFNADGSVAAKNATISFDEDFDKSPSFQETMTNQSWLTSVVTHEISHAFGLADAYPLGQPDAPQVLGTMGQAEALGLLENPNLPAFFWDPSAIAAIQTINQGLPITLGTPSVCTSGCAADNEIMPWVQQPDGAWGVGACTPPSTVTTSSLQGLDYYDCQCGGLQPELH